MKASQPNHSFEAGDQAKRGNGQWLRPAVSRLAAGSAEDGNINNPDGGQPS